MIKPLGFGVTFDGTGDGNTWAVTIDGHVYISATYSKNAPPDIDFDESTGEVWDMNLTVLAGKEIQLRVSQDATANSDSNEYVVALTGTWLRT